MTHQQLDPAHVGAGLQQMRGEGVPQGMRRDGFLDTAALARDPASQRYCGPGDRVPGDVARK